MGIFGNDKEQDARIDALEVHVRLLTQTVQANQVDIATSRIAILALKGQVDEKVTEAEVDPAIVKLNAQLATAREDLEKSSAAASESWNELQAGVRDSFATLSKSVNQAYDRITRGD